MIEPTREYGTLRLLNTQRPMHLLWCAEYIRRLWIGPKLRARNGEAKLLAIYVGKKSRDRAPTTRVLPGMTTYQSREHPKMRSQEE